MIWLLDFSEASIYLLRTRDMVDTIWSKAVAYISKNLHHQKNLLDAWQEVLQQASHQTCVAAILF